MPRGRLFIGAGPGKPRWLTPATSRRSSHHETRSADGGGDRIGPGDQRRQRCLARTAVQRLDAHLAALRSRDRSLRPIQAALDRDDQFVVSENTGERCRGGASAAVAQCVLLNAIPALSVSQISPVSSVPLAEEPSATPGSSSAAPVSLPLGASDDGLGKMMWDQMMEVFAFVALPLLLLKVLVGGLRSRTPKPGALTPPPLPPMAAKEEG